MTFEGRAGGGGSVDVRFGALATQRKRLDALLEDDNDKSTSFQVGQGLEVDESMTK